MSPVMAILRTLLIVASISLVVLHTASSINYCPPVWTQYQLKMGTFCYRLFGIRKTWQEAEATCRRYTLCKGKETAHLVSIGSAEEEAFVSSYWKEMRGPFEGEEGIWLGYHKTTKTSGGSWTRLDNLKTPYKNWDTDMDGVAIGNCSQQVATELTWPKWQRVDCADEQHFICKMHAM